MVIKTTLLSCDVFRGSQKEELLDKKICESYA